MPRTKKELQEFRKYLITNATKSEMKLYNKFKDLRLHFKFQHIIEPFIVDFYFPRQRCIIELDGKKFHNKVRDASRDLYLRNAGFRILRIKSYRCFRDLKKVMIEIGEFLLSN